MPAAVVAAGMASKVLAWSSLQWQCAAELKFLKFNKKR